MTEMGLEVAQGQGWDQHGAAFGHEGIGALVAAVPMLDRINAGGDGAADRLVPHRVRRDLTTHSVALVHERGDLLLGEHRIGTPTRAGYANLHDVGAVSDVLPDPSETSIDAIHRP